MNIASRNNKDIVGLLRPLLSLLVTVGTTLHSNFVKVIIPILNLNTACNNQKRCASCSSSDANSCTACRTYYNNGYTNSGGLPNCGNYPYFLNYLVPHDYGNANCDSVYYNGGGFPRHCLVCDDGFYNRGSTYS